MAAASALVALESLTKSVAARRPTCSMRCARPGKLACRRRSRHRSRPSAEAAAKAGAGVLGVVGAAQRAEPASEATTLAPADAGRMSVRRRRRGRRRAAPLARCARRARPSRSSRSAIACTEAIVDADDGRLRRRDEPLLDRRHSPHRAMPVEMVRRDVEEHADRRIERRREIDLEGRAFDDVHARRRRRLQRQDRACRYCRRSATSRPAAREDMGDQRRRRRLAVGAGDGDEGRARAHCGGARGRTARCRRSPRRLLPRASSTVQCGSGCVSGTPGDSTSAAKSRQSAAREIAASECPAPRGLRRRLAGIVVPDERHGAAGRERQRGREARAAEPEDGDALALRMT